MMNKTQAFFQDRRMESILLEPQLFGFTMFLSGSTVGKWFGQFFAKGLINLKVKQPKFFRLTFLCLQSYA